MRVSQRASKSEIKSQLGWWKAGWMVVQIVTDFEMAESLDLPTDLESEMVATLARY